MDEGDNLYINGYWNHDENRNGFAVRCCTGEKYQNFYKWLATIPSARSSANDFPWDYIYFTDLFDEQLFLEQFADDIYADIDEPFRRFVKVPGRSFVPDSEKIVGQKYLETCGHYHTYYGPTPDDLETHFANLMAEEIAAEIDREIYESLKSVIKKPKQKL